MRRHSRSSVRQRAGLVLLLTFVPCALPAQGVHTWYGNGVFMRELDGSIRSFFGDRVGTYIGSGNYAFTLAPMSATNQAERMLVANQFLAVLGHGAPGMRVLPDQLTLYDYSAANDGLVRDAIVTPRYGTTVLAAALVHFSCGTISSAHVHDTNVIRSHYESPNCNKPTVTAFFEDRAGVNPSIRKELLAWGTYPIVELCESNRRMGLLDYPANSAQRRRYAKHLQQLPPCRVRYDVVTLNP